ncbi:MAG: zinc-dependent metalloprotease [Bacteroidota bacterium]
MQNTLISLLLCSSLFLLSDASAQSLRRHYATQKVNRQLLSQVTEHASAQRKVRQFLASYQQRTSFEIKTIPVIFHVVHHETQERISEAQIYSQIEALNRDFSQAIRSIGHPAEQYEGFNRKQADDTYIRFCLADVPNNIHYVSSNVQEWTSDHAIKYAANGGADVVTPENYLNVWIGKFDQWTSGYAQFPLGPIATDGIAIDYRFFGTIGTALAPYDEGKSLSHLVANYLGVPDIWSDQKDCGDDYIYDTPIHNSPNYGCPPYKHVSTCGNLPVEMSMNLMDNTDDACQYQFTYGQRLIMTAVLSEKGMRHGLLIGESQCGETATETTLEGRKPTEPIALDVPKLQLQPNPVNQNLQITASHPIERIEIYSLLGKQIHVQTGIQVTQLQLEVSEWLEGSYVLRAEIKGEIISQQFVISHL